MTPDDQEDDRTVIRPPGSNAGQAGHGGAAAAPAAGAGFQRTEWSAGRAAPPAAQAPAQAAAGRPGGMDRTQVAGAPPPQAGKQHMAGQQDMAGNLPVGTMLSEFEITSLIGEGGFGIVYLAHDHSLQRRVALKEYMPSSLAQRVGGAGGSQVAVKSERHRETFEAGLKSFINEARLLASFDHPSLVKVYRFWEGNGTAYMVMPFLEGTTLKDVLRGMQGPPDEAWLRAVLGPLTEALLVIHAEQCYHRDIAPDNVMLLPISSRWLLLDFGAARRVIGDMTQALTVILKPGYAPVEQYAEIPGMKQGPWTDVYALAAVVYFAIMGRTPPPSVGRLLNDTYVPLEQSAAGRYDARFLAAIDRALAVRPEQRTQSIGELRQDLGLGEVSFDPYTTRPLPPGMDQTMAISGTLPTGVFTPPPAARNAPAPQPAAAPVAAMPARAQAPSAQPPVAAPTQGQRKGNGLAVGVIVGVVVLAALGVGGYALFAPAPRKATVAEAPAVTPPAVTPSATPTATPTTTAPAPATASAPAAVPAAPAGFDVTQELNRVVQAATPGFNVRLSTNKSTYRIGKDELGMTLESDREGFVYVFVYGADKTLMQLYPSVTSGSLKIKKGQKLKLPEGGANYFEVTEPAGPEEVLVLVSTYQRDHSDLRPRKDGTVRIFPTGAEAAALIAQSAPNASPPLAGRALCPTGGACADEFGAALNRVEIVR